MRGSSKDTDSTSSLGGIGSLFQGMRDEVQRLDVTGFQESEAYGSGDFTVSFLAWPHAAHRPNADGPTSGKVTGQKLAIAPVRPANMSFTTLGVSVGTNGVAAHAFSKDGSQLSVYAGHSIREWALITVAVQSEGRLTVFVNDKRVASGTDFGMPQIRFRPAAIGGSSDGAYEGWLADVTLHEAALTTEQVRELFLGSMVGATPPTKEEPCAQLLSPVPSISRNASAAKRLAGLISDFAVLTREGSPYYLDGDVTIAKEATVVVEAG